MMLTTPQPRDRQQGELVPPVPIVEIQVNYPIIRPSSDNQANPVMKAQAQTASSSSKYHCLNLRFKGPKRAFAVSELTSHFETRFKSTKLLIISISNQDSRWHLDRNVHS